MMHTSDKLPPFLSVKQVAEYLQLHEKKVYALANEGQIPATKVTGKWLFPRELIDQWLLDSSHGGVLADRLMIAGSDDPLLYRLVLNLTDEIQSQALIGYTTTGTQLGLALLARRRVDVCCIHWGPSRESSLRHHALIQQFPQHHQWMIVRAFEREQGLMLAPNYQNLTHVALQRILTTDLRWVIRQEGAGSQRFLLETLAHYHLDFKQLTVSRMAYSEREAASLLATGQADIAPGTRSAAAEFGLGFVATDWEAFDFVLNRGIYFRHLFQKLLECCQGSQAYAIMQTLGGYRLTELGKIIWSN